MRLVCATLAVVGILIMTGQPVQAEEKYSWIPELLPVQNSDVRKPTDVFAIKIPQSMTDDYLAQLSLELDNVDITSLVEVKDDMAVVKPPKPLSYGKHKLRLVRNTAEGDIDELALWQIEIRQSSVFRQMQVTGDSSLSLYRQLEETESTQAEAMLNMQFSANNESWKSGANADVYAKSIGDNVGHETEYGMGSFLFTVENPNINGKLGHHAISHQSLLMPGLFNRGASVSYNSDDQRYASTVFSIYSSPVTGFTGGMGLATSRATLDGLTLTAYPYKDDPGMMYFSALYIDGEQNNSETGLGVVDGVKGSEGDAVSLQVGGKVLDQKIDLRAEYANTNFDYIPGDPLIETVKKNGDAYSLMAQYTPGDDSSADKKLKWSTGIEYRYLSSDFKSIANPAGVSDRALSQLFVTMNKESFSTRISHAQEHDNVEDNPLLPQIETNLDTVNMTYSTELKLDKEGKPLYGLLGQQNYNFSITRQQQKKVKDAAVSSSAFMLDSEIIQYTMGGSFIYEKWNWQINHSIVAIEDFTGASPGRQHASTGLTASIAPSKKISISSSYQLTAGPSETIGVDFQSSVASLGLGYLAYDGKLTTNLNYSVSQQELSNKTQDLESQTLSADMSWTMREKDSNKAGIKMFLRGIKQNITDNISNNKLDSLQVFLGITVGLPFQK